MKTYYHPDQTLHHPRTYLSRGKLREPQEVPDRARILRDAAAGLGFEILEPHDWGDGPLRAVHSQAYLDFLRQAHTDWMALGQDWGTEVMSNVYVRQPNALRGILAKAGYYLADGSCPIGEQTWQSAYWSSQAAISAAQALLDQERYAYALCRPPGHHARADAAGGFCYLNNAAIAAQHLRSGFQRVAILDTDMHHGQGIQEIFYERDDVLYVSIHGDPENFYPGVAGFAQERGAGKGIGCNLNLPMPHGSQESVFFEQLHVAASAIDAFQADALVLSLGFDIYEKDPQAMVSVSTAGFHRLGECVQALNLPTLVVQEGGYYLEGLKSNAEAFFHGLLERSR